MSIQQFQVSGMTCGHCEASVRRAIGELDPQAVVQIDRASGKVVVESGQDRDAIAKAIEDEGYVVAA